MNPLKNLLLAVPLTAALCLLPPSASAHARPSKSELKASQRALEAVLASDTDRLMSDKAYAEQVLARIDKLPPLSAARPEVRNAVNGIRMIALMGLEQYQEALRVAFELVAARPKEPSLYGAVFQLAALAGKPLEALQIMEKARANADDPQKQSEWIEAFDTNTVYALSSRLRKEPNKEARWRLAEALIGLGWPGPDRIEELDGERLTAIEGRLAKGDQAGAKALVAQITTPEPLLRLLLARKNDRLFDGVDRLARMRQALADYDRSTAERLKRQPDDLKTLLARTQHLRSVGRDAEALALLEPHISDMTAVKTVGEDAFWLVNEAAYAMLALGRGAEAVALMERLLGLGMDDHPELISMAINASEVMNAAGRHREGTALAAKLAAERAGIASPYGHMWMWSTAACGLALGGDVPGARPWLDKLEAGSKDNQAAHMRALLCAGDLDGAERLAVKRLAGDDPETALVAAQDYQLADYRSPERKLIETRWKAVLSRPAVQAAIAPIGRTMSLPLSRVYWGEF